MKKCRGIVLVWVSICSGILLTACGEQGTDRENKEFDASFTEGQTGVQEEEPEAVSENEENIQEESQAADERMQQNEEKFYEAAETLEMDSVEAKRYYERLCEDNVFRDGTGVLTALAIEDLDGNGQKDMIAMVQEGEFYLYGAGGIYFYMNEDQAFCFRDEAYPFLFDLYVAAGDFDDDGNTEIVFESSGTGCGGAGDWHLRMLKYKDHTMEKMDFPSESYEDDSRRIYVEVTQEEQENTYSAYCPYFDETIAFEAKNFFEPNKSHVVGGNSRGFFNICSTEYEGRDALVVSEYLCGEGGNGHCVGEAKFLILWEKDGSGQIVKWWIDQRF